MGPFPSYLSRSVPVYVFGFNEMEKKGVGLDVIRFDMNTIVQFTLDDVLDKNWGERSKISASRMEGGSGIVAAATGRSCLHWPSLHLGSCWIPPCWSQRLRFPSPASSLQVRAWQSSRTH
ncbi:hypothetical protein RchiOBHm_Chr5g0006091 [Rosa chinensis]|uniref:Uncharacterized protein n=1 Tax=Rosa chinensis TaxID=74649 RepID=A0A2P6Q3J1_ROSCH|nr:hypothetical protein RchiOBHm_Chr5g0006091 [Rosa chinensis]